MHVLLLSVIFQGTLQGVVLFHLILFLVSLLRACEVVSCAGVRVEEFVLFSAGRLSPSCFFTVCSCQD